jgi:hypothetical protein
MAYINSDSFYDICFCFSVFASINRYFSFTTFDHHSNCSLHTSFLYNHNGSKNFICGFRHLRDDYHPKCPKRN